MALFFSIFGALWSGTGAYCEKQKIASAAVFTEVEKEIFREIDSCNERFLS